MKKIALSLAAAVSTLALTSPAVAQQRPVVLVVDTDSIGSTCTACKAAATQIQQKEAALTARAQQLRTQLQTEGKPIQDALDALGGQQPDAALQTRITAFQTKERNANTELNNAQRTHQSTLANVNQQIANKLLQVVEQIRARRGASIVVSKGGTLASDTSIDITTEALSALNQQLPAVSVTPMPQAQQAPQTKPQGR